jgi:ubiquinone/menaquinone biosynthesis C-methylase UbiE
MDEPEKLLKEIDRVLASDGALLIIDFRRDMPRVLFRLLDASWQLAFCLSPGRFGFRDSVRSAWLPEEIKGILDRYDLGRFRVRANQLELWITGYEP